MKLISPSELLRKHPEFKQIWQTPQDIGYLLRLRVIKGRTARRATYVDEQSAIKAFNFINMQ